MLSQRSTENRNILREEWSVVQNNKEILYEVKHCKCVLRYWWDGKIRNHLQTGKTSVGNDS